MQKQKLRILQRANNSQGEQILTEQDASLCTRQLHIMSASAWHKLQDRTEQLHTEHSHCTNETVTVSCNAEHNDAPLMYKLLQHTEQDVCVKAPLMRLIQHHNRVLLQL